MEHERHAAQPPSSKSEHKRGPEAWLAALLPLLPLHAEEDAQREVLAESVLHAQLQAHTGLSADVAAALLQLLRRQLEALSLLDPVELLQGRWAFVSFPAALLARSWLATLAQPGQLLLPPEYWESNSATPAEVVEEQRALLRRLELQRIKQPQAAPIRTVHVAWGLIRLGDQFLLLQRDDKTRPGHPSDVLPGGRFKLSDLPPAQRAQPDLLRALAAPDAALVAQHLHVTLERELREELALEPDLHYRYTPHTPSLGALPPFCQVEGAQNRHAYTAYRFALYSVQLTPAGEALLLQRTLQAQQTLAAVSVPGAGSPPDTPPGTLVWYSSAEAAAAQRSDGRCAYLDALRSAWGEQMQAELLRCPDSAARAPRFASKEQAIDLPGTPDAPLRYGAAGKESDLIIITPPLSEAHWELLLLLGWHARRFPIELRPDSGLALLVQGWVYAPELLALAQALQAQLQRSLPGLLELREGGLMALRVVPDCLYLGPEGFGYRIEGSPKEGGLFTLKCLERSTRWGTLCGQVYQRNITAKSVATLRALEKGDEPEGDWQKNLRDLFGPDLHMLGLRRLWSSKHKTPTLREGLQRLGG